ncbi:hypothetical protein CYMTET_54906 [Cymbomonas tetramitiformis]|uniref:Dienelactone hydrolase domain-containing protein n=1 Tax=Cymbomonas tetramitiformis TaxID=36881 RepID=A0AAE0ENW5_9CHLO|nr:hypothetical protein CYMTET_54906 [Cymbomonas tetramitiformis]|eukprot:gene1158-1729_t
MYPKQMVDSEKVRLWTDMRDELRISTISRREELREKVVRIDEWEMRYLERRFGSAVEGERSLWISMHGGGGCPAETNDAQWQNQIQLYAPEEGIVVAPRAPTDNWNLWHESHIDDLFDRLILNFVMEEGVNPDRVYLLGYSAGGDGVYQIAPRMADRFAAAAMMAGHPNDASPLGLRNLPFFIFMGGDDAAYDRNKVAAEWGEKLAQLRDNDPGGYLHKVTIYEGLGHWMNRKDAEAIPLMAQYKRDAWPNKLVWRQNSRLHHQFYWLAMPEGCAAEGQTVWAEAEGQRIEVRTEGLVELVLRLSDELVDLDQPVEVVVNGETKFEGLVPRDFNVVRQVYGVESRSLDPRLIATAELCVDC